jgi:hypothetical protein
VGRHTTVESKDERHQVRRYDDRRVEERQGHVAPDTGDDAVGQAARVRGHEVLVRLDHGHLIGEDNRW